MENITEIKEFIKNNKCENFYFNGLKENTIEKKYQFLKNHFEYDIMNSWNDLKTIANNVKIYKMGLSNGQELKYFELTEVDPNFLYDNTIYIIRDFEKITKTKIYSNGRSGGYLIIVPDFEITQRNEHIFEYLGVEDIKYYNNYKEFKKWQNEYSGGCYYQYFPANYSRKQEIENAYFLVKAFDKLCDILRDELIYILNNAEIEEKEETFIKKIKNIII